MLTLNESTRDNLLSTYMEAVSQKFPELSLGQFKSYLMRKFVTEANIHALSLGSNYYLAGVTRYYFNGDLTANKKLNVFYPKIQDQFIPEICERLDEIIVYLRNAYVDTYGKKMELPEDFGGLTIAQLFKKYSGRIDRVKDKSNISDVETLEGQNSTGSIGQDYTYEIMYSQEDCKKYETATSPGAWCITYAKQHYRGYADERDAHFIIFRQDGYEKVPRKVEQGYPLDRYGLSLIAVRQSNKDGSFIGCTSRWNHGSTGTPNVKDADDVMSYEQFKSVVGITDKDFKKLYETWKQVADAKLKNSRAKRYQQKQETLGLVRQFKYCQMLMEGGASFEQLVKDKYIDQYEALTSNTNPRKGIFAVWATNGGRTRCTICDKGKFMPEEMMCGNIMPFNYSNTGIEKSEHKDRYAVGVSMGIKTKYQFYDLLKHKLVAVDGHTKFNEPFRMFGYTGHWYLQLVLEEQKSYSLYDIESDKPLQTPDGNNVFEFVMQMADGHVLYMSVDKMAGTCYWFDVEKGEYIKELENRESYLQRKMQWIISIPWYEPSRGRGLYSYKIFDFHKMKFVDIEGHDTFGCVQFYGWVRISYAVVDIDGRNYLCDVSKGEIVKYPNGELAVVRTCDPRFQFLDIMDPQYHKWVFDVSKGEWVTWEKKDDRVRDIVNEFVNEGVKTCGKFGKPNTYIIRRGVLNEIDRGEVNHVVDSFKPQEELNEKLWVDGKLNSRARLRLLDIADRFVDSLGVSWVKPEDIIMTGSLCNYNWSEYSDIDLHIIIDFKEVDDKVNFVKDYFDAKRKVWNDSHENLKIYGFPVELYVQNKDEEHVSSAVYSLEKNEWVVKPTRDKIKTLIDSRERIARKAMEIIRLIDGYEEKVKKEKDIVKLEDVLTRIKTLFDRIKRGRKADLKKNGEYGDFNLLFKTLRRTGYIKKLADLKIDIFDKYMSIK